MFIITILTSVFFILLILHLIKVLFYWKRKNVESSFRHSLFGSFKLLLLQTSLGSFCNDIYQKCSKEKYRGFFIFGTPAILIKDLNLIRKVLIKDFDHFHDRTITLNKEGDPMGTGTLFIEKGPIWKFMRAKISPSFSTGEMKRMFPQMSKVADNFIEYLMVNEGKAVDMEECCPRFSTDIVMICAFGVEENCFKNEQALSRQASKKIFINSISRGFQFACYFIAPVLVKLFNLKWIDPLSSDFVRNMFKNIKETRLLEGPKKDFVGGLIKLEEQNIYHTDPEEIVAQALQFFLAGFETVSSTIKFTLYELAYNQEIQSKLRESIKVHMQSSDEFIYNSLMDIDYLSNTINETLRKYPVLPFLDRKVVSDYYVPEDNLTIEAGTNVYISVLAIQRDPAYFPDPLKFNPERFSNENAENIIKNSYFPFGDGPRNCIGARFGKFSAMVAVTKIIQNFKLSLADEFEEVDFDPKGFLLAPTKKIKLTFHKI